MAAVDSFPLLYREIARSCSCYVETLALVGALYTASKAVTLMRDCYSLIRLHFIPRLVYPRDLVHRYGKWAIISGASEAIAKAYAEELARHGVCVILITTDIASLNDAAKTISDTHGVEAVLVEADFSQGALTCNPVKDVIKDKDIGFVINCLNSSLDIPRDFHDISESELWQMINNSVSAASLITRLALPGMAERRRGVVVNISSGRCSRPCAQKAALSASTAFFDHFSRALHYEYGHRGVFVQSLLPGKVASEGDDGSIIAGWLVPQPHVYARHALSTLGISHRTTGYWPHTLQLGLVRCVPEWIWVLGARVTCRTT
ncbi:inactive hydroxysteroid dehydrogenase-like protein 1 [Pangasianodon hypophthalmus]|uniref:inactive hydroxysteroid dehydrogenase-like protein 1 n=1 Tax=Pangasianodon hypophthalmus TaxID=310915 RepID=UPI00230761E6|nr:inactive hydroxysteroid dehydrogenase-like protein 1 [Pangasianodon hypophthalmus]